MHSTTYRRQAKRIEAAQAIEQRIKRETEREARLRDHYTEEDRRVAEEQYFLECWRAFLAEEI